MTGLPFRLDCGHAVKQGQSWLTTPNGTTRCFGCQAKLDRAYVADPLVFTFAGVLDAGTYTVRSVSGTELAAITSLVDGIECRAQTSDGRVWRARGAFVGGWGHFQLVED